MIDTHRLVAVSDETTAWVDGYLILMLSADDLAVPMALHPQFGMLLRA